MSRPKCGYCNQKAAKRYCPSLDKLICSFCCGTNRLKNISCDENCRFLDNETYHQQIHKEKELKALLENIPHSEHNDIFKSPNADNIAYAFESFFADCYIKGLFNLTDQKVKETLANLYDMKFREKSFEPDEFMELTLQVFDCLKDADEPMDLIGKVMLRIIISINKVTGGQFGPYGYLNFIKNNFHPNSKRNSDVFILETKNGKIITYQPT